MNQLIQQEIRNERTLDKARLISAAKCVRRTSTRKIWIVKSQSTDGKFYRVMFDDDLDCFVCDCKSFEFSSDNSCKHVYACAIYEGGLV